MAACQQPCQPPCQAGVDLSDPAGLGRPRLVQSKSIHARADMNHPRVTMNRGTQRIYVRLNTLHYILAHLHSVDKSLSFFPRSHHKNANPTPSPHIPRRRTVAPTHFDQARSAIHSAILHISELAAYRLIFRDSRQVFYDYLYSGSVAESRLKPALRALKQNLNFIVGMLADRAQPVAVREVMKASFEVFLLVVLAGGVDRAFARGDQLMIAEDLANLKRVFCSCGEGLVAEEVVEREAAPAEGVVALMGLPTEKIIEEFARMAPDTSGPGLEGESIPIPITTGRWGRSYPNTVLRVLCHRDDDVASRFLKRTFDLPKRR